MNNGPTVSSVRSLTERDRLVLEALKDEEIFGLDIVERTRGAVSRSLIYLVLSGMEDRGLIASRKEDVIYDERFPRRLYRATDQAKFLLREEPYR